MIGCRGSCGHVSISTEKAYINGNAMCLDNLSDSFIDKYLFYCLECYDFSQIITGSSQPQITRESLKKVKIPVISKELQVKIATVLDIASNLVDIRKRQLIKLDELIRARFIELFGNEKQFMFRANKRIADVCESRVGIVIQPTQYYTNSSLGIRAFRSLNVKPFSINDSDWVYFSPEDNKKMSRTQVRANDVAVVRSGVNLGDSCVIPFEYDGCNAIDIMLLTCNHSILPIYLASFINYPVGKKQILDSQRGGAIKHLNLKQLENAMIYVPPMDLQEQFAAFVEQTDKSKLAVQRSLDKLEILKKSLMQKYFG